MKNKEIKRKIKTKCIHLGLLLSNALVCVDDDDSVSKSGFDTASV